MDIGEKLKKLREDYGYSQSELSRLLNVPQTSISNYEAKNEISGVLEYIYKLCKITNMPVAEFFMEKESDKNRKLPSYITPANAAMLKILNTQVDIKTRIKVEEAFVHILEAILVQYGDRLQHLPEYQEIFGGKEKQSLKVAEKADSYTNSE